MRYLSLFSGIEAASVAWSPLGWEAAAFAEIDPFPCAVLKHHYPDVPNLGDVEKANLNAIGPVDLVVGGSPCQSYSIAGKRLGLDDPRGNLALVYGQVVYRKRPRWFVFENVPGLLSSDSGWDFGTLLAAFSGNVPGSVFEPPENGWRNSGIVKQAPGGYGLAWRVLDAQFTRVDGFGRAVPQRRRRVFVVGCLGDWRRAAAVLFERASLSWDSPPRRQSGERPAPTIADRTRGGGGLGTDFDCDGGLVARAVKAGEMGHWHDPTTDNYVTVSQGFQVSQSGVRVDDVHATLDANNGPRRHNGVIQSVSHTLNAKGGAGRMDYESETLVAHSLRGDGFDASEDGTGRGTPFVSVAQGVALRGREHGATAELTGDVMTALRTGGGGGDKPHVLAPMIAFSAKDYGGDAMENLSPTLRAGGFTTSHANAGVMPAIAFNARQDPDSGPVTHPLDTDGSSIGILARWRVRRLTPVECLRLQGFPDDYLDFLYRGKPAADGPKYRAIGNSMAVNCMRWLGTRIKMVDALK